MVNNMKKVNVVIKDNYDKNKQYLSDEEITANKQYFEKLKEEMNRCKDVKLRYTKNGFEILDPEENTR